MRTRARTHKHAVDGVGKSQEPRAAHDLGACPEIGLKVSDAPSVCDYFGTPTNRAPVNLPSSLMSGA